jgi:peroxidase
MNTSLSSFFISLYIAVFGVVGVCYGGPLSNNFYEDTCPLAEEIVRDIIWKHVAANSTLPAKFLRMHFHDCFVRVTFFASHESNQHMHACIHHHPCNIAMS